MNKNFDKADYKDLKAIAKAEGVVVFSREINITPAYNGVSIAFRPMSDAADARMLAVAVSYCAPEDKFKKKVGKYQALLKFEKREYVQLPLAEYYNDCGAEETKELLFEMFSKV